jgi:hypothetical protein
MSTSPAPKPGSALSRSIGSENLTNSLSTIADAGLDATITALHGVPVLGAIVSLARAGFDIKNELEFRKVVRFLQAISETSAEERAAFTAKLQEEGKSEEFGQNILLLLSRLDDMAKPGIVGRILAAHIKGDINYDKAMRLVAIVDRCYLSDLEYLKTFKDGTQGEGSDIAAMLFSARLLANNGIDGGTLGDPETGGIIYGLNSYAELLLKYGL